MTFFVSPSSGQRAVAALTLLAAVTLWCASLITVFLSENPLQFEKAFMEVVVIGSWACALGQIAFRSKYPTTMLWPLSSGKLAFCFSVAYSGASLACGVFELRSDDVQQILFWVQAPTI